MKSLMLSLMSVSLLLAGTAAKADPLTLTLSQPFQNAFGPAVLEFNATVTNTTGSTLFLNGDSFSIASPLSLDDTPFNTGFPLFLGAGDSFTGELFTVDVPLGTPFGLHAGSFEILGGINDSAQNVEGSAVFDVGITPEPSSFLLLATGVVGGLAGIRARCRRLIA